MHSPKRKFRGEIHFEKPVKGIGSQVSYMADSIEQLKSYSEIHKNNKFTMYIYENKKTYPEFDWQMVEKYSPNK